MPFTFRTSAQLVSILAADAAAGASSSRDPGPADDSPSSRPPSARRASFSGSHHHDAIRSPRPTLRAATSSPGFLPAALPIPIFIVGHPPPYAHPDAAAPHSPGAQSTMSASSGAPASPTRSTLSRPADDSFDAASAAATLRGKPGYVSFMDVDGLGCPFLDDEEFNGVPNDVDGDADRTSGAAGKCAAPPSPSRWMPGWLETRLR